MPATKPKSSKVKFFLFTLFREESTQNLIFSQN